MYWVYVPIQYIDYFLKQKENLALNNQEYNLEFKENNVLLYTDDYLIDDLGFSNFDGANFKPKYAYFKTIIDTKPYLCIQVEIPGEAKVSCRAEISGHMWNIIVKGNKIVSKNEIQDESSQLESIPMVENSTPVNEAIPNQTNYQGPFMDQQ